jgi:hypothetical protein
MEVKLKNSELVAPNGKPFPSPEGKDKGDDKENGNMTLFEACGFVLTQQMKGDEELGFKKTCERQDLAKKFFSAEGEVIIDSEDVTLIETRAARAVVGPVCWAMREAMKD